MTVNKPTLMVSDWKLAASSLVTLNGTNWVVTARTALR